MGVVALQIWPTRDGGALLVTSNHVPRLQLLRQSSSHRVVRGTGLYAVG